MWTPFYEQKEEERKGEKTTEYKIPDNLQSQEKSQYLKG